MNCISITGRLGRDAELHQVGDSQVASFSLAMHHLVKREKVTQWFDVSVWGKRADVAAKYLKKGAQITVIGRLMPVCIKDGRAYLKVDAQDFNLPARAAESDDPDSAAPATDVVPAAPPPDKYLPPL